MPTRTPSVMTLPPPKVIVVPVPLIAHDVSSACVSVSAVDIVPPNTACAMPFRLPTCSSVSPAKL